MIYLINIKDICDGDPRAYFDWDFTKNKISLSNPSNGYL